MLIETYFGYSVLFLLAGIAIVFSLWVRTLSFLKKEQNERINDRERAIEALRKNQSELRKQREAVLLEIQRTMESYLEVMKDIRSYLRDGKR